jgi:hypothetical protein
VREWCQTLGLRTRGRGKGLGQRACKRWPAGLHEGMLAARRGELLTFEDRGDGEDALVARECGTGMWQ